MDLDIIRTFTVASRLLNFRRTAQKLYISQPTVTAHIQKLEETLNCELFRRDGRGVRLTAAGKRFLPDAISILEKYDSSVASLTQWLKGRSSTLNIAASPLVARSILPRAINRFASTHPDIEFRVDIVDSTDIVSMVIDGQAHLGLSRIPHSEPGVNVSTLFLDPVFLIAGPDTADSDWKDLLARNTLLIENHPEYWDELLIELSIRELYPRTLVVTDVDITKHFIAENVGLSFLPRSAVWKELLQGSLVQVETPELPLPTTATYVVEPSGATIMVEQVKAFLDLLRTLS